MWGARLSGRQAKAPSINRTMNPAHPLDGFEGHVAGEAVGHEHVRPAPQNVAPLQVAREVDRRLLEQAVGGPLQIAAFGGFRTDVEQAHPRFIDAVDDLGRQRTHHRELDQVGGPHVEVGACVQQQGRGAGAGDGGGDGRAQHTLDPSDHYGSRRHGPSGGTGGHEGVGLSRSHQPGGGQHGGTGLVPHRLDGVVVHLHHVGGVHHFQIGAPP